MHAVLGMALFGHTLKEFSSVSKAMQTCWTLLLGGVADSNIAADINKAAPSLALFWYMSFVLLCLLMLFNMLLAIILDAYSKVVDHQQKLYKRRHPFFFFKQLTSTVTDLVFTVIPYSYYVPLPMVLKSIDKLDHLPYITLDNLTRMEVSTYWFGHSYNLEKPQAKQLLREGEMFRFFQLEQEEKDMEKEHDVQVRHESVLKYQQEKRKTQHANGASFPVSEDTVKMVKYAPEEEGDLSTSKSKSAKVEPFDL
jgi:hypothetical protein